MAGSLLESAGKWPPPRGFCVFPSKDFRIKLILSSVLRTRRSMCGDPRRMLPPRAVAREPCLRPQSNFSDQHDAMFLSCYRVLSVFEFESWLKVLLCIEFAGRKPVCELLPCDMACLPTSFSVCSDGCFSADHPPQPPLLTGLFPLFYILLGLRCEVQAFFCSHSPFSAC